MHKEQARARTILFKLQNAANAPGLKLLMFCSVFNTGVDSLGKNVSGIRPSGAGCQDIGLAAKYQIRD